MTDAEIGDVIEGFDGDGDDRLGDETETVVDADIEVDDVSSEDPVDSIEVTATFLDDDSDEGAVDLNVQDGGEDSAEFTGEDEVVTLDDFGDIEETDDVTVTLTDRSEDVQVWDGDEGDFVSVEDDATVTISEADGVPTYHPVNPEDADDTVSVVFQGQDVYVFSPDGKLDDSTDYELRSVNEFDGGQVDSSSFEEQLNAETVEDLELEDEFDFLGSGELLVEIDTDDLEDEDFFLRGGDLNSSPPQDDTFEITVQDFDAEFDDDQVTDAGPDSDTELDIDSDRSSYSVNASADGDLDDDELFQIALPENFDEDTDTESDVFDSSGDFNTVFADNEDEPETEYERAAAIAVAFDDEADELADVDHEDIVDALRGVDAVYETDVADNPSAVAPDNTEADDADAMQTALDEGEQSFGDFSVGLWDSDEDDYDEKVVFVNSGDVDEDVDFQDIDEGDYTFDFNVSDTEASASDDISVSESDAEANFDEDVYTQTAGDLIEFTVELEDTDETFVQFGDEDAGFIDILYLEDDGGEDDEVNFWVNTRLVGTMHDEAGLDADDVFYSDDDIVESYLHDKVIDEDYDNVGGATFYDDDDLGSDDVIDDEFEGYGDYLEELDLVSNADDHPTEQIVRPLQPTNYDITADENGHFIAEDDESDVDDEIGFATLDLVDPSLDAVNTWVGPEEDADDEEDIDELVDQLTERDNVAIDDLMVAEFQASGIFGHLAAISDDDIDDVLEDGLAGEDLETLVDDRDGEGVELTFEDVDATGNQDANDLELDADEDEVFVLIDNDNGAFYVVVDTSDEPFDRSIDDGDEFEIELEYETDDDDRFRFFDQVGGDEIEEAGPLGAADGEEDEAFPYFQADSSQSVSTTFTFEDRMAEFDNLDEDDNVQIETSEEAVVSGETNVAPGSDTSVRMSDAGDTSSFLTTADAEIDSDGTFATEEVDFSDRAEGDEASLDFRIDGSSEDDADGIFVEAVEDVDDEEVDDHDDEEVEEDDEEVEEDDDVEEEDDDVEVEDDDMEEDDDEPEPEDDDGVPGFGIAVALFALIAAGMLALRRQN
ncbi:S-layer protein [Natrarchaeobaculum sulfurireducens]|uniref:S-layer protein n=1 Tax=Natrarchaeobaculum sulfurireducens TaxID=2044521 RepID=A0A346PI28_9EURY|nr:S-layer protein [Natrarchaeobaculum sulfurireducens]